MKEILHSDVKANVAWNKFANKNTFQTKSTRDVENMAGKRKHNLF